MIKVLFQIDADGTYTGFSMKGHAGYAERGHDIVCAAVTALAVNAVNSIEKFTEDEFQVEVDEEKGGLLIFRFTSSASRESILLLDSLKLGLEGVSSEDNNAEYISVKTRRCRKC